MGARIDGAMARTANNKNGVLNVCLNYGGRAEIVDAVRSLVRDGISESKVDEAAISARMYQPSLADPDLIIRTAGEHRVSNFLLWQGAYAEMLVTDTLWPDFGEDDLEAALADYASRVRRFGARPALEVGLGVLLCPPGRRQGLSRWAMGLAGALYIGMPFNYYLLLYTSQPNGTVWTLFTIFAVVVSDAAALLVGSRIGRHPFFAAISPRKTVEGAVAGVVGSVLVMLVGVSAVLGINPLHAIAIGLLVGTSALVGDLVESQMKRLAEVKDSSHLIPGHGGVLDRIDSILFPPILVYFYVTVFHLL